MQTLLGSPEEMRRTEEKKESGTGGCGRRRSAASSEKPASIFEASFLGLAPSDLK